MPKPALHIRVEKKKQAIEDYSEEKAIKQRELRASKNFIKKPTSSNFNRSKF